MPIRILIADDHTLVRAGLHALLSEAKDIEVVAEASDGYETLQRIGELKPDIALIDISMPGLNGIETAARAVKENPRTRVIMLSMHADDEYVRNSLLAGASGYVLKGSDRAELEMAVRAVARGESWLSPQISRTVVENVVRREPSQRSAFELLTPRQREILQLIAEGRSTKEIAQRLSLSVKTVETHRSQIMDRLGIRGVAALVRYAIRVGMIRVDQ